jgi:hypothetical protein
MGLPRDGRGDGDKPVARDDGLGEAIAGTTPVVPIEERRRR